ncbi:uncharacterized protein J4E87_009356 [Alternaria ethzedia]|uniref:uncharacterized protein n=1 Tax=Alternaria ethzedia TaxID=181014 RepID=UPI0020C3AAB4|nr:uncharacterized protein J4E87_009356 [Alternaria ethzedia]KAI4614761.1 hypothetical protein J4E87_009356 [Alternaria ethzedia]
MNYTLLVTPPKVAFAMEHTRHQATAEVDCEDEPTLIVQLRPPQHALDHNIVRAASTALPALAPTIEDLGLTLPRGICAYEMKKVDGTPLSRLQQHGHSLDDRAAKRLERLITSFADLIAQNWHSPREVHDITRTVRADSPMDEHPSMLTQCRGKVGSTMISRLERLASELPDAYLRERARETMRAIQRMEDYPVVLNHGDLIPSNILVDHDTWEITGLVDWAEAEYLPFGTCLYGLEHLLGTISQDPAKSGPKWTYFNGATQLRELFWSRLIDAIPELEARMGDVRVMRDVVRLRLITSLSVLSFAAIVVGFAPPRVRKKSVASNHVLIFTTLIRHSAVPFRRRDSWELTLNIMVSTRRGTANAEPDTAGIGQPRPLRQASDTIHIIVPSVKKVDKAQKNRRVPETPPRMALSGNISEHDLSLTSPSTGESPVVLTITTAKERQGSTDPTDRTVSSALRRLAPKPFANMSGSSHNPIIVDGTSPPPRRATRAPKRRQKHKKLSEPHQFIGNGYRELYSYGVSRPALAAMPANGSTFTGHQSHDIYRMMSAKITAAPEVSPNAAWGRHTLNVPFEVQYPLSAPVLAQHAPQHQPAYAQHYHVQVPSNTYVLPMVPSQNENSLRRRAVHHIQEYSRTSPQKRKFADADLAETSDGEAKEHQRHARPKSSRPTAQSNATPASSVHNVDQHNIHRPTVHRDPDPNLLVSHLIEHTSLITSLLQVYPHSTDKKGLQNEISMMVQIQNQYMSAWMEAESQSSRKRTKNNGDGAVNLATHPQPIITPAMKVQSEKDHTVRQALSADADMWQDGTGHGVADAFAVAPQSSPVASTSNGKAGADNAVVKTPPQSITDPGATSTRYKGNLITPVRREAPQTLEQMSKAAKNSPVTINYTSQPFTPPKDLGTPTKLPPLSASSPITPTTKDGASSQHGNGKHSSSRSKHITPIRPVLSSEHGKLQAPGTKNASSSFRSESSSDFGTQRPVFRFERRVAGEGGEAEANDDATPTVNE